MADIADTAKDLHWYVYLLSCGDGSLYCGIAKDTQTRLSAHVNGKGAKYTRNRGPLTLVWQTQTPLSHGDALRLEREIKRSSRKKKCALILGRG